jgi:hypothetical protein
MRRALLIVSLLTLVTVLAALVAQMLTVTQGIYYDPNGQPIHPTALTQVVTILGVVGMFSLPLAVANFVLGIIVTTLEKRYIWLVTLLVAGVLVFGGLFATIWILLSERSPIAFQTPLALIPLVMLAYVSLPARRRISGVEFA